MIFKRTSQKSSLRSRLSGPVCRQTKRFIVQLLTDCLSGSPRNDDERLLRFILITVFLMNCFLCLVCSSVRIFFVFMSS